MQSSELWERYLLVVVILSGVGNDAELRGDVRKCNLRAQSSGERPFQNLLQVQNNRSWVDEVDVVTAETMP